MQKHFPLRLETMNKISDSQVSLVTLTPARQEEIKEEARLLYTKSMLAYGFSLMEKGKATDDGDKWTKGWLLVKKMTGSWQAACR